MFNTPGFSRLTCKSRHWFPNSTHPNQCNFDSLGRLLETWSTCEHCADISTAKSASWEDPDSYSSSWGTPPRNQKFVRSQRLLQRSQQGIPLRPWCGNSRPLGKVSPFCPRARGRWQTLIDPKHMKLEHELCSKASEVPFPMVLIEAAKNKAISLESLGTMGGQTNSNCLSGFVPTKSRRSTYKSSLETWKSTGNSAGECCRP